VQEYIHNMIDREFLRKTHEVSKGKAITVYAMEGVTPIILSLGITWSCVVKFTTWPPNAPWNVSPDTCWTGGWKRPRDVWRFSGRYELPVAIKNRITTRGQTYCGSESMGRVRVLYSATLYTSSSSQSVGWNSSVRTATRNGLGGPGIESQWRRDIPYPSRPALGPTQPPIK